MNKILIAMSGGVDSSVSAALLKKAGFVCHGVYMKVWSPELEDLLGGCPWKEDVAAVEAVGKHLGITTEVWDVSREYFDRVVSYFLDEYARGRTPNPDILCNSTMKFGLLLDRAKKEGFAEIATGHYARISGVGNLRFPPPTSPLPVHEAARRVGRMQASKALRPASSLRGSARKRDDRVDGQFTLRVGVDTNKDQSYFLYRLTQDQLAHARFPLGEYTKPQVRALAQEFNLPNADRKDSQGVCFIGKIPVQQFLKQHLPVKKGPLVTTDGEVVGEHDGAHFVTIGQRHGIGAIGGGTPYFVIAKDLATNTVTVGAEDAKELERDSVRLENVHWISNDAPPLPLNCMARIRYRGALAPCVVEDSVVRFESPVRAVAAGQSCVFYDGDTVLGGGIITDDKIDTK